MSFCTVYTEPAISRSSRPGLPDGGGGYEDSLVTRAITFSRRAAVTRVVDSAPGVLVLSGFFSEPGHHFLPPGGRDQGCGSGSGCFVRIRFYSDVGTGPSFVPTGRP